MLDQVVNEFNKTIRGRPESQMSKASSTSKAEKPRDCTQNADMSEANIYAIYLLN